MVRSIRDPPIRNALVQNLFRGSFSFAFRRKGCLGPITNLTEFTELPTEPSRAYEVGFDPDGKMVLLEHFAACLG